MKSLTVFLALSILFSSTIRAFEKQNADNNLSNKINLNIQSNFFNAEYESYSPLNPGFEILYEFVLTDKISVLSGLNYIYSRHYDDSKIRVSWGTFGHELFFPLTTKLSISRRIYFTTGIYAGYLLSGKVKYRSNFTYSKTWKDVTEDYASNQTFSADLLAGLAYSQPLKNSLSVDIIPFAKLKITDNWLERYRTKSYFGIKFNFSVDTKNLF
jgi:hypothetical protein